MTTKIEIANTEGIAEIDDKMTRDLNKLRALIQLKRASRDETKTRLKLRRIAPQFTEKELEQVFSPYGQVKKVTLFRVWCGHPGTGLSGFVEYTTKQEAEMAVNYLDYKEFYGQKLQVEFEEESLSWMEIAHLAFDDEEEQVPHPSSSSKKSKGKKKKSKKKKKKKKKKKNKARGKRLV